eukprot:GEMP01084980.1.p1 GENE.GEMP01084980.1~~GEMP01084980.1.p1  ORF type:complete len:105 (+),score=5.70 GEMP01084980.1:101-415(+)
MKESRCKFIDSRLATDYEIIIIPSEEPRAYNDINMESVAGEQTSLEGLIKLRQRELTESAEVLTKHQAVLKERTQLRTRLHAAEELLESHRFFGECHRCSSCHH